MKKIAQGRNRRQDRQKLAAEILAVNATLSTKQKLDKALLRGGSKKEVARLQKLLDKS